MRTNLIVLMIATIGAACGSDTTPVDMVYRATVTTTENTCDDYQAPEGMTAVVDVFLQSDGYVTLMNSSGLIPGESEYKDIGIFDDEVDYTATETWVGDVKYRHTIKGTITDEEIDIKLTVEKRKPGAGEFERCRETAHIVGTRRPVFNPLDLDGKYRVRYDYYGYECPGGIPEEPVSWNVPLDVNPYADGKTVLAFDEHDENVVMEIDTPTDGAVDWSGPVYLIVPGWFYEFDGTLKGTLEPGNVSLELKFADLDDTSGCASRIVITGGKFLPNMVTPDNAYRTRFDMVNECEPVDGEPQTETFEYPTEIVGQDDGSVSLLQGSERITLEYDGYRIHNSFTSPLGTATLTYEGVLDPPYMHYDIVYRYYIGTEEECTVTYTTDSHVRYFIPEDH